MSKQIKKVSYAEFLDVLRIAQKYHSQKDEPIPSLTKDSEARIDSCLNAPFQYAGGAVAFRGLFKKAAALFYYIAKGHPLGNGNKRMACAVTSFFLFKNSRWISLRNKDFVDLARYTANSSPEHQNECMQRIESELKRCCEVLSPDVINEIREEVRRKRTERVTP